MAAKCNITTLALEQLSVLQFGGKLCKSNIEALIENYIEYLDCEEIDLTICNPDNCKNDPIIFNCNFNVLRITADVTSQIMVFTVGPSDFAGGTAPYTYDWTFEQDDFDSVGPINQDTLLLTVKTGKITELLVSSVKVKITDANGCIDEKLCYLAGGIMRCGTNYAPCSAPSMLAIINNAVHCVRPTGLIVTNN